MVYAIAELPDHRLVAGGTFLNAGGAPAAHIAIWDGAVWSPLGAGVDGSVRAVLPLGDGSIIVAGSFVNAGGNLASNIARWDGHAWNALGTGVNGTVYALAAMPTGEILVGGGFTGAGGSSAPYLARWDGHVWTTLGDSPNSTVNAITASASGDVYIGGSFAHVGSLAALHIAHWNGSAWSAMASGLNNTVNSLSIDPAGGLLAAGAFNQSGSTYVDSAARWDGSAWSKLGSNGAGISLTSLARMSDGSVYAGGNGRRQVNSWSLGLSRMVNGAWGNVDFNLDGILRAILPMSNGDLVVSGNFTSIGGIQAAGIARKTAAGWQSLGSGIDLPGAHFISSFVEMPDGSLIAAGYFSKMNGVPVLNIARWDGSVWQPVAGGIGTSNSSCTAILAPDGSSLIVYGAFATAGGVPAVNIAKFDGVSWLPLGTGLSGGTPLNACFLPDGRLLVVGQFTSAGGQAASGVALWDGRSWVGLSPPDHSLPQISGCVPTDDGGFLITNYSNNFYTNQLGDFAIAKWDGTQWSRFEPSSVHLAFPGQLARLPDGRFAVEAGIITVAGQGQYQGIAFTDGVTWENPLAGVGGGANGVTVVANGDVIFSGSVFTLGAKASASLITYSTRPLADFNNDGFLDIFDFNDFITCFEGGECPTGSSADFNGDGFADIFDFNDFVTAFEQGC